MVKFSSLKEVYKGGEIIIIRKDKFQIREIEEADLLNGFLETLDNLSKASNLSLKETREIFRKCKSVLGHKILVAVKTNGEVIGTITIILEPKFRHGGKLVAHMEEVATKKEYEGAGVCSQLIEYAKKYAKNNNCYRIILDCSEENSMFYKKKGFYCHGLCMKCDL